MMFWSISTALKSDCFDRIVVSTDDKEISCMAESCGALVPFVRPAELSNDHATTQQVISHAISWHQAFGFELNAVCCLYATAPFVQASDLEVAFSYLQSVPRSRFIFSATSFESPTQRAFTIDSQSGLARMIYPELFSKRSQDLESSYYDAGQFYWGRPEAWKNNKNIFEYSKPYLLPRWRVQDIDDNDDWIRAEHLFRALSKST